MAYGLSKVSQRCHALLLLPIPSRGHYFSEGKGSLCFSYAAAAASCSHSYVYCAIAMGSAFTVGCPRFMQQAAEAAAVAANCVTLQLLASASLAAAAAEICVSEFVFPIVQRNNKHGN